MSTITNRAAVLYGLRDVRLSNLDNPCLQKYQVRVELEATAICGTQCGEWLQTRGPDLYLPHCFGHEGVGRVTEIGDCVQGLSPGDRVIISWMRNDISTESHEIAYTDAETRKRINAGQCCTFMRFGVFNRNRLSKIDSMSDAVGIASLGCAFLTAMGALRVLTQDFTASSKSPIAVVGLGGVGLAIALLARAINMDVVGIDVPLVIRDLQGQNIGFDLLDTLSLASKNGQFDATIVCSGAIEAFEIGQALLPTNGGRLLLVGNPSYLDKVPVSVKPLLYGRTIVGVGEKDVSVENDINYLINLIAKGKLDPNKLVRRIIEIEEISDGLEQLAKGVGGRVVIDMRTKNNGK